MKALIKNLIYFLFSRFLIRKGDPGSIYLTYDDGPHPENTVEILEVLARYNVKATFFMIGAFMDEFPEIVKLVTDSGHTIGFHSYRHTSLKRITLRGIRKDLAYVKGLSRKFNYKIQLYRPPFGDLSILPFLWLILNGWKIVMWSLDCRDSFDSLDQVKINIAPNKVSDGEIILFHDDFDNAKDLVEHTMQQYKEQGIECRSL